jgi:hypothetical protein
MVINMPLTDKPNSPNLKMKALRKGGVKKTKPDTRPSKEHPSYSKRG